jgi:NTP pyrophosphatase (non-canonical NTP hydrolase)
MSSDVAKEHVEIGRPKLSTTDNGAPVMNDIVDDLREAVRDHPHTWPDRARLAKRAADEIEKLRNELAVTQALLNRTNLAALRNANAARQQEWDPNDAITLAYRGNELAGEVGEACNVIKKLERERLGIRGSRASNAMLAEELADVLVCVDLTAMQAGIDLDAALRAKFNSTSEKYGLRTRLS